MTQSEFFTLLNQRAAPFLIIDLTGPDDQFLYAVCTNGRKRASRFIGRGVLTSTNPQVSAVALADTMVGRLLASCHTG